MLISQKKFLIEKVIKRLRSLPTYNAQTHGIKVRYNKPFELELTAFAQEKLPLFSTDLETIIRKEFLLEGIKIISLMNYISYYYVLKNDLKVRRKSNNIIIRKYKFL